MKFTSEFLYNPVNTGPHCHSATLMETNDGDLLACWYAYPDQEHQSATLALARKPAGKTKWNTSTNILPALEYSAGNPVLFQEPGGRVWILFVLLKGAYWNDAVLQGSFSDDGGGSWSVPVQLWKERGMMIRHAPVVLSDGSLLLPAYDERDRHSVLLRGRSPFALWQQVYRFDDLELIQPVLIREPDRLSLFFRPADAPRRIWRSHSTNEGSRWSTPIRTPLPNPLSGLAAFSFGDAVGVVYNHTEKHQRHPLSIAVTTNGGTTWSKPWDLDRVAYEVSYPSFLCSGDTVHGTYTYNRRFIKYVTFGTEELMERTR